ncbi:hypothetical protein KEM52_006564 [Ascosphaera acerosa]|nr:hypothetical protein KEM52_006564 [Ascosphaera acerosa]
MLCLSPSAHRYHSAGYFGLRPLALSADRTELQVEFWWLHQDSVDAQLREYTVEPELTRPEHRRETTAGSFPHGPQRSLLLNHVTCTLLASGDVLTLRTDDVDNRPLPELELLDMQWVLQLLVAASCASMAPAAAALQHGVAPYDGAWDDGTLEPAWDELYQPERLVDWLEDQRRFETYSDSDSAQY